MSREKMAEALALNQSTLAITVRSPSVDMGLENTVAAHTSITYIDGKRGTMEYVGIDIGELVRNSTFEETTYLIWNKRLPSKAELAEFKENIRAEYGLSPLMKSIIHKMPRRSVPMDVLRTLVSAMGVEGHDSETADDHKRTNNGKAMKLLAKIPAIIAAFDRHRKGLTIIDPKPALSIAENFLYMLHGQLPTNSTVCALDACLILHADHGLCASTFAARVTTSTMSDLYSAFICAIGTLKGPLHGGAAEDVLLMFQSIGSADKAEAYVADRLRRGGRIPGFGHRVYKTMDPRAVHLYSIARRTAEESGNMDLLATAGAVESSVRRRMGSRGIHPNVDFYSAVVYHCLGIDVDLYTCVFSAGRAAGWAGHCMEQVESNRLIRPMANYVGPRGQPFPQRSKL